VSGKESQSQPVEHPFLYPPTYPIRQPLKSLVCSDRALATHPIQMASKLSYNPALFVTVIVNSRFLQRPQKQSRENQIIHRRLTWTKLIGRGIKLKRFW